MADDSAGHQEPAQSGIAVTTLFYANAAAVRGGPFDVALDFGYAAADPEGQLPVATRWLVRVAMSWEHARAFHELIGQQIQGYEDAAGPLPDIEKLKAVSNDDN